MIFIHKGKGNWPWWEISRLSMEITLLSRGDYLSNWFWYSSQSIVVCRIFAPFIRQNDIKWIRTTPRTFSILWAWFYFANELETHDEKGDFLIKKKEGMMHDEVVYATHPLM
jgi:homogentisate 1,2-dioxygenase